MAGIGSRAIGVDFGTSTSLVAERDGVERAEVLPLGFEMRTRFLPSVAALRGGRIALAEDAESRRASDGIIRSIKRAITEELETVPVTTADGVREVGVDEVVLGLLTEIAKPDPGPGPAAGRGAAGPDGLPGHVDRPAAAPPALPRAEGRHPGQPRHPGRRAGGGRGRLAQPPLPGPPGGAARAGCWSSTWAAARSTWPCSTSRAGPSRTCRCWPRSACPRPATTSTGAMLRDFEDDLRERGFDVANHPKAAELRGELHALRPGGQGLPVGQPVAGRSP